MHRSMEAGGIGGSETIDKLEARVYQGRLHTEYRVDCPVAGDVHDGILFGLLARQCEQPY